ITIYPKFSSSIVDKTSTSKEKATIFITYRKNKKEEEYDKSFGFEMRGRNDLVYSSLPNEEIINYPDMFENLSLISCFITPEDPVIKYYTQAIQQKILKGETASVTMKDEEALRFLIGIYNATLKTGMVYSGTKGIPIQLGDVSSLIQHIRLPREVVSGNTGLCIELSCLYASILSCAGISPVIFLVPGHAYPGIRINNNLYAIEATGIGGEGLGGTISAEKALEKGMKQLNEFIVNVQNGDPRYDIVDVHSLFADGINPMELKDDTYLRQKVDELALAFEGKGTRRASNPQQGGANEQYTYSDPNETNMTSYKGVINFKYPAFWLRLNNPNPTMPPLITQLESPDRTAFISVFQIQGYNSTNEAMVYLQQLYANNGVNLQYQNYGASGSFTKYSGESYSYNGNYSWSAFMKRSGGGVTGIILGAPTPYYQQSLALLNQIVSTIH
ncbi:MAG: hypothetical protein U1C46_07300, partial [Bacteroidales bacterium]|nr:hypothetical protein [Bacteroidales bacterium]